MTQIAVKERGIIFTAWSIPKIIDKTKTMTRRTWGLEEINKNPDDWELLGETGTKGTWRFEHREYLEYKLVKCPYGQVGDRLWVKETWSVSFFSAVWEEEKQVQMAYKAGTSGSWPYDFEWRNVDFETWQKYSTQKYYSWHSPLFMPRFASRINREITDVSADRLQGITEEDAKAEGCNIRAGVTALGNMGLASARHEFKEIWDALNPRYPWDFNPWVWPIGFKEV